MVRYRELVLGLRRLDLPRTVPVLVHSSLSSFGRVLSGPHAVVGALLNHFNTVVAPTFTYDTMVTPPVGPPHNALDYQLDPETNAWAEFFRPTLPADKRMGIIADTLRQVPKATRSTHPILSFTGVNAEAALQTQTLGEPLAPVAYLADGEGWILLLGVPHTANTSIHLGERLAGRKTFMRFALMPEPDRVVPCPSFPACSDGFESVRPMVTRYARVTRIGEALIEALPMVELVSTVRRLVEKDPLALLCQNPICPRCTAVRRRVRGEETAGPREFLPSSR
ncbi:MAG: AAC(3) family N-acetyltransferase [Anaerolineae bacterium]|nr:MAG: AAC(3) family N-acetyltransferase [Anaerolineae bacterium]